LKLEEFILCTNSTGNFFPYFTFNFKFFLR